MESVVFKIKNGQQIMPSDTDANEKKKIIGGRLRNIFFMRHMKV